MRKILAKENKKGGALVTVAVIVGIVAILAVLGLIYSKQVKQEAFIQNETDKDNSQGAGTGVSPTTGCPDTLKKVYFRMIDGDSASSSQLAGASVHIFNYDPKTETTGSWITSDTLVASTWSSGTQLCGNYIAYVVTGESSASATGNSTDSAIFSVKDTDTRVTFTGNSLTYLQTKIKDRNADTWFTIWAHAGAATNSSTAYVTMNSTTTTSHSVGTDGNVKLLIQAQSVTAKKFFGDKKLNTWMCIDEGTLNLWDEPTVKIGNSVGALANVKSSLSSNDLTYSSISGSEYCYNLGTPIDSAGIDLYVDVQARSGQDPTENLDFYFFPEGKFKSVKSATLDKILTGIVTDAATQSPVGFSTTYNPKLTVDIA